MRAAVLAIGFPKRLRWPAARALIDRGYHAGMKDDPNPYHSPADALISAELTPRPLFDRLLLVGAPFAAGASMVSAFDCVIRERPILAGVFIVVGALLLWQAWRWSR